MKVVSLYDHSGIMARPWVEAGHEAFAIDIIPNTTDDSGVIHLTVNVLDPSVDILVESADLLFAFPPCTDLAVSGAAHFAAKGPQVRIDAMRLVYRARDLGERYAIPYMIENPVSVIATEWRKPDYYFHPYEYGGYLPEDHVNTEPLIPSKDAYPKKTCLWVGNGFRIPPIKPVDCPEGYSPQHLYLGGKSERTKRIRSLTPEGFARAVYAANHA